METIGKVGVQRFRVVFSVEALFPNLSTGSRETYSTFKV